MPTSKGVLSPGSSSWKKLGHYTAPGLMWGLDVLCDNCPGVRLGMQDSGCRAICLSQSPKSCWDGGTLKSGLLSSGLNKLPDNAADFHWEPTWFMSGICGDQHSPKADLGICHVWTLQFSDMISGTVWIMVTCLWWSCSNESVCHEKKGSYIHSDQPH